MNNGVFYLGGPYKSDLGLLTLASDGYSNPIFPVFYADVTAVWKLNKYKRIIVNLAGIYFQLLISMLLIVFLSIWSLQYPMTNLICIYLFKINIFVILYALFPFFRNDGYWVYSDFFDLPNLSERAFAFPKLMYRNFLESKKSRDPKFLSKADWPLFLYSIGNYLILSIFIFYFTHFSWITSTEVF